MSHQTARAPVSPVLRTTSYGQVIEYIQSEQLQPAMSSLSAQYQQSSYIKAKIALQTDSTLHHILILPTSIPPSHIQRHPLSRYQSTRTNHHIPLYQYHLGPKYILLSTSQSTITYSTIASMQTLDHYTLGISTASLSSSTRSWETQTMQNEESCSGVSQIRGAGQMPLVYWLVT